MNFWGILKSIAFDESKSNLIFRANVTFIIYCIM